MRICVAIFIAGSVIACTREAPEAVEPEGPTRPAQPAPERVIRAKPCENAPAWTEIAERCEADGFIYGVASVRAIPNPSMRVHLAADHARASLAEPGTSVIVHSEVLDLATCDDSTWALARRPRAEVEPALAACGDRIGERSSHFPECPDWSTALATLDGDRIRGVGYVIGVRNEALARSAASNRAIAEQRKSLGFRVTRSEDGSVSTATTSEAMAVKEEELVETCGEITVVRITSRVVR